MLLSVHNLPPNASYKDIESLIITNCGISSVILENLVREGSGSRVTVKLRNKADAAIIMRQINGLILDNHQLFIEEVRHDMMFHTPDQSSNNTEMKLQQEYQLFLENISDPLHKRSRASHLSAPFNRYCSSNNLSSPVSFNSNPQEKMFFNSSVHDAPNTSTNQAVHLLRQTQALQSTLGQNSLQQQKSPYECRNIGSSTNYNFNTYSGRSEISLGKNDHRFGSADSQKTDTNYKSSLSPADSKNSGYMREEGRRFERSTPSQYNAAPPNVIDHRERTRHDGPYQKVYKDSPIMSGNWKRRTPPCNVQMQKSKYPRKDPSTVFSSTFNPIQKSFHSLGSEESMDHGSDNSSYRSKSVGKVIPNLMATQPILMPGANKNMYNSTKSILSFDVSKVNPNASQMIGSAKFNVPKQESFPRPKFNRFGNMVFKKKGQAKVLNHLKKIYQKDDTARRTAVSNIIKEVNMDDFIKVTAAEELGVLAKLKFHKIFKRLLKFELLRRVGEMLGDELNVPNYVIIQRYKSTYDSSDHYQMLESVSNRANKKFGKEFNKNWRKYNPKSNASTAQKMQNPATKIVDDKPTEDVGKQQINQSEQPDVPQDNLKPEQEQAAEMNPDVPNWFRELKRAASFVQSRVKVMKLPQKRTMLNNLKTLLLCELSYYKDMGYEFNEGEENDTLSEHLIKYCRTVRETLLVISPVRRSAIPNLRSMRDFLKPYNVVGLRQLVSKNIYLVLLENEEECAKLYVMKRAQIDGILVRLQQIDKVTNLCKKMPLHMKKGKKSMPPKNVNMTKINVTARTENVTRTETGSVDSTEITNNVPTTQITVENPTKITEAGMKGQSATTGNYENVTSDCKPSVATGSSENVATSHTDTIDNYTSVEKDQENDVTLEEDNAAVAQEMKILPTKVVAQKTTEERKSKPQQAQASTTKPDEPDWFRHLKCTAAFVQSQVKQNMPPEKKTMLANLKMLLLCELLYYKKTDYNFNEAEENDTLAQHLLEYCRTLKDNMLVILPVGGLSLPEFHTVCEFMIPYNLVGLRKFVSKNIYLMLLENEEDCAKLHGMKNILIDGKTVELLPIAKATDICKDFSFHCETQIESNHPDKPNYSVCNTKTSYEKEIGDVDSVININNPPTTIVSPEQQSKITEAVIKNIGSSETATAYREPGVVIGSSENVTSDSMQSQATANSKNDDGVSKGTNIFQNSKNNDDEPAVNITKIYFVSTPPDDSPSDDDVEVNMEDLEDY